MLSVAAAVLGAIVLQTRAPASRADGFEAVLLDGQSLSGELVALTPTIVLNTAEGETQLAWSDLLSLAPRRTEGGHAAQPTSAPAGGVVLRLADGSRFPAAIGPGGEKSLSVVRPGAAPQPIDLEALESITVGEPTGEARARLDEALGASAPSADAVVVSRGDKVMVLSGALQGVNAAGVRFHWNGQDVELPWARVAGLRIARNTPRGASHKVVCADGRVFAGRVRDGDARRLTVQSGTLGAIELSWDEVARVDCLSERLVFLSDLKPAGYVFEPFFDRTWDYALDASLTGRPIRVGGRAYTRGVSMHSRSALTYRIDAGYRVFAATAGILDEMEGRGRVAMRLRGDGRVLWENPDVRGGQPPVPVVADLTGVRELTLEVDYGEELDLADHACWAFARLIR